MLTLRNLGLTTALCAAPFAAFAHHGASGQFDMTQTFDVTGTITRISLVNPHAYVYFDVADDAGEVVNMRCELSSGSLLKRSGWTEEMFEIGSEITINGSPDRDDPTTCHMNQITFASGVTADRESAFDDEGTVIAAERETEREDGTPNIDGNWAMANPQDRSGPRPTVELTDAGAAAVVGASADQNPRFNCQVTNIAMDWVFNGMVNTIVQSETEITLYYGFMDLVRTIHLDGTEMPDDFVPNRAGFSTGSWEGDTLVVTTTGFDEGWIMAPIGGRGGQAPGGDASDRPARPEGAGADRPPRPEGEVSDRPPRPAGGGGPQVAKNSEALVVTERFSLNDDGTILIRDYTFDDPEYLAAPLEASDEVTLTTDAFLPYDCDDLTNERTD